MGEFPLAIPSHGPATRGRLPPPEIPIFAPWIFLKSDLLNQSVPIEGVQIPGRALQPPPRRARTIAASERSTQNIVERISI
jgi:hypothetical protein